MTARASLVRARRVLACLNPPALRAAWWAYAAARQAKRAFPRTGGGSVRLPPPPEGLPAEALEGVRAALTLTRSTCLVRSFVLQRWFAARGDGRDVVIGVTPPSKGFSAHAWLDGDEHCHANGFVELKRISGP